ncbi:MAG TPA: hypothetical protein VNK51_22405 [Bradyrhizobium sp.]|nr:hypothetical protein [Bradyrhizobium sp.]
MLTTNRLRAVFDACSYRSAVVVLGGRHCLPAGGRLALQFGDVLAFEPDGTASATLRCSLTLNGDDGLDDRVSRWDITKVITLGTGREKLRLKVEADLLVGSRVQLADVIRHGDAVQNHVRLLIADARAALDELGRARSSAAALRIEARFVGDLVVGRAGFLKSALQSTSPAATQFGVDVNRTACDWLTNDGLPRLTLEMARMLIAAERSSVQALGRTLRRRPCAEPMAEVDAPLIPVPAALH